jgi:hypothetical protein
VLLFCYSPADPKKDCLFASGLMIKTYENSLNYEVPFSPQIYYIVVSADGPEVAAPFNLPEIQSNETTIAG